MAHMPPITPRSASINVCNVCNWSYQLIGLNASSRAYSCSVPIHDFFCVLWLVTVLHNARPKWQYRVFPKRFPAFRYLQTHLSSPNSLSCK